MVHVSDIWTRTNNILYLLYLTYTVNTYMYMEFTLNIAKVIIHILTIIALYWISYQNNIWTNTYCIKVFLWICVPVINIKHTMKMWNFYYEG